MAHFAKEINANELVDLLATSDKPVLVDMWAPWCGPCVALAPLLEEAAEQLDGEVVVVKLNIEDNRDFAVANGVRSIPTLLLFKNNEVTNRHTGMVISGQASEIVEFAKQ